MWELAKEIGYKPMTNFWDDFTIADKSGEWAIKETADKLFNKYKDNYKYLTELVMVINHKSWEHATNNVKLSIAYSNLYYEYDNKVYTMLEKNGDQNAIAYYFRTLD